ncbi:MAG: hypothetical protein KA764_17115, partial [Anaerolineales bacterium]|nr:hypothetical protein [Anaerolineales bacterium]
MFRDDLLLRARLTPPRPPRRTLPRPALTARLREALDYRLTLLQAGTGYGKSTALAALTNSQPDVPVYWYSASEADADPQRFLVYLIGAFRTRLPALSDLPQALLHEAGASGRAEPWPAVVDALLNALAETITRPALLIVDDYHFVGGSPEVAALTERFLAHLPPELHVLLATRYPLSSPALTGWRARGEVLEFTRRELAFEPAEIEALFRETYGLHLNAAEVAALADQTEGWPIALQLVWQGLRARGAHSTAELLAAGPASESLTTLFDFLANEVLGRQPAPLAAFLRATALLRELTPGACAAVAEAADAEALLQRVLDLDLFIVTLGERHYRYHHLFHDFLRGQWAADPAGARERHRRAAAYFRAHADLEEAIYHGLAAQTFEAAAADIAQSGEALISAGRLEAVAAWVDALPPDIVADQPLLQRYLGDIGRLRSRFGEALAWYQQAEKTWRARGDPAGISRALRGQALVYLDTVRPAEAEHLLQDALRYTDGLNDRETRARLLELLAENKLNMGKPDEAERLRVEARALRDEGPTEDVLSVRVKLRTGRLEEARHILADWLETERQAAGRGQVHPPRAHRETVLLLSLIQSFLGNTETAFALGQEGVALGERLKSPFVTTVGLVRLGHGWQLRAGQIALAEARDQAIQCYQAAIALGDQISVRRLRAEAMWGLTRAYGLAPGGDLASAERTAAEGVEICQWAGDQWVSALVELALGSSYVLARRADQAVPVLNRVLLAFRECGDTFGRAAARLWLSLAYLELGQGERLAACADELLALCETHQYDNLLTRATLLGPSDPRRLVPLLLEARARRIRPAYVTRLLAELGLPDVSAHAGFQLRVQTLGTFRVWRGAEALEPRDWKREKARQLFQLLLTERRPWQREEITERLWPALAPEAAGRDFKVALNALYRALEPDRPAEAPSAFIARDGPTYLLRPDADLWLDTVEFEREAEAGLRLLTAGDGAAAIPRLRAALALYTGDYLPEALYDDWATETRERLLARYLRAADRLAGALAAHAQYAETLAICQQILARDPCWERAHRLTMLAYAQQDHRPQALRAYQRCVAALKT